MTVPATSRRAGPYSGNGSTTSFSFSFKTFAAGDLQVTKTSATGIETVLVLNSGYSVTLNSDQDASPGGSITYPISGTPLISGEKLTIVSALDYEQTTDLLGGGAFNARTIEDTFDRTVIQIQQLEERADRAMTLPVSATASTVLPVPQRNEIIAWNDSANALVNIDATDLVSIAAYADWRTELFSGDGSTFSFTLAANPGSVHNMDVSIGGVTQQNGVDFSVSGTLLTFISPPPAGTNNVLVRYGQALPLPIMPTINASQVVYNPAGTGAVVRTAQDKLREVVSVLDFGADPSGVVDATSAFQLAVNAVQAAGGGTVFIPAGRYKIMSQILITGDNVSIKGEGNSSVLDCSQLCYFTEFSSLDIDYTSATYYRRAAFAVRGTFVKESYLDTVAMPVLQNQSTLTLVSGGTTGIQIGDSVYLRSNQHWYGIGERFAISKVIGVNAGTNVVTLMDGVPHQFDSTGVVRTWNVDTSPPYTEWGGYYTWPTAATNTRLVVWRPVKNFELSNLSAEGGGLSFTAVGFGPGLDGVSTQSVTSSTTIKNGTGQCLLHAQYAENVRFQNISVTKGFRGVVFWAPYTSDVSVTGNSFRGLVDDSFVPTENVNSGWYPMYLSQGRDYRVMNNVFNRTRHGPDGNECFNYVQTGNVAYRTFKAAYGSHQEVYDLTITANTAYDCYGFAVLRAKDATVVGNSCYASNSNSQPTWGAGGITTTVQTQDTDDPGVLVICDNSFIINASLPASVLVVDAALQSCNISGNSISVRDGAGISVASARMTNVTIGRNNITFTNPDSAAYPGATVYANPSHGISVQPRREPSDYAAYLGSQVLTVNVDGVLMDGNTITNYGGTATNPNTGHGILLRGSPTSNNTFNNILVTNNVGRPQTNDSSFFVRVNPGGFIGPNFTISNNTFYGASATKVFGFSSTDEYLFYQAPVLLNNSGHSDASKTHLSVGDYTALGNGTTLIKGATLNNPQPDAGESGEYIVTASGTTGTLTAGITATTTSGSATVTLSGNAAGDGYVYAGSYISIAGANTGVRVLTVSDNYATITLEAAASASVSGAAVTRYAPVISPMSSPVGNSIPQNSKSASYTTVFSDAGKHLYTATTGITFTIAANSSVAYPVGTALTFVNAASANITIAISTDTMTLAGTTTTGSRTLAQNGVATALKVGTTSWLISGTGLT